MPRNSDGLAAAGLPVVVNPAQVRSFALALGKRAKTDAIDAAVIAHFVAATAPEIRPLPDEETQIVAMIGAESQREKRAPARMKKILRLLKALQKELDGVDHDIRPAPVEGLETGQADGQG